MNIVIVGGGLTGAHAVQELRKQGYDDDITLVAAEPHLPYDRPPLSKDLLLGKTESESLYLHDAQWYADQDVDLHLGTSVTGIDLDRSRVTFDGSAVTYDRLLLATGSAPRRLPLVDSSELDTAYLRTIDDALALKSRLSGSILILGGGWIGLEVASAARQAGAEVTVVESSSLPLLGVLGPELGLLFADLHRQHGVDLRLHSTVESIHGREVVLSDGHRLVPDTVVVAIGASPLTDLAARAGLATSNGVLVDPRLRTGDPHVYAAGDVANHDHPTIGRIRVEHWDNAIAQGQHASRVMLGSDDPYTRKPYFFTDQYDLGMEFVGTTRDYDELVFRGDVGERMITAFWLRDDTVIAGMHINDWDAIEPIRRLVGQQASPQLRDPDVELARV
jgi:NADPH-dependent 2,4-dienoyl-CoA reductase/sulfur reductase-like enzyme